MQKIIVEDHTLYSIFGPFKAKERNYLLNGHMYFKQKTYLGFPIQAILNPVHCMQFTSYNVKRGPH
jgi:hypothetical protein